MNEKGLNNQTVDTNAGEAHTIQTNNTISSEPLTNQEVKPVKKKKYWLIPVIVSALLVISSIISTLSLTLKLAFDTDVATNGLFGVVRLLSLTVMGICALGLIPSVIVAVVLSNKNKQNVQNQ